MVRLYSDVEAGVNLTAGESCMWVTWKRLGRVKSELAREEEQVGPLQHNGLTTLCTNIVCYNISSNIYQIQRVTKECYCAVFLCSLTQRENKCWK